MKRTAKAPDAAGVVERSGGGTVAGAEGGIDCGGRQRACARARSAKSAGKETRAGSIGALRGTGDPIHSVSFIVEATSRAIHALRAATVADSALVARGEALLPKLHAAAKWLADPAEKARTRRNTLDPFSHRFYLRAAALLGTASLTNDPVLEGAGLDYLQEGLTRLRSDNVEPERGGFDINYQSAGTLFAARCLAFINDAALRERTRDHLARSVIPILTRIAKDGSIDTSDSSRIKGEVSRSGRPKTVSRQLVIETLVLVSEATGDKRPRDAAIRIATKAGWL